MDDSSPKLGQLVKIIRGRDAGKYAVIIKIENERYLWIADGDKRKFDRPKKKNIIHLELQDVVSEEVVNSLRESGRVTNGKLRYAVQKFLEQKQTDEHEKGE
jgi:ribosomal protein L14E/L6E/L27E